MLCYLVYVVRHAGRSPAPAAMLVAQAFRSEALLAGKTLSKQRRRTACAAKDCSASANPACVYLSPSAFSAASTCGRAATRSLWRLSAGQWPRSMPTRPGEHYVKIRIGHRELLTHKEGF